MHSICIPLEPIAGYRTCCFIAVLHCRSAAEREVRAMEAWSQLQYGEGQFVWLLANTLNERTWMVQKELKSCKRLKVASCAPAEAIHDVPAADASQLAASA